MTVYRIVNMLNGNTYIGQTIQPLKYRWRAHCNRKRLDQPITRAIKKYGKENFYLEVLGEYADMQVLNDAEEYFIDFYNSLAPNGYNLHTGGSNSRPSEETRRKLSESHKGKTAWNKGLPAPWAVAVGKSNLGKVGHNKGKPGYTKGMKFPGRKWVKDPVTGRRVWSGTNKAASST